TCVIIAISIYIGARTFFHVDTQPNNLATGILISALIITPTLLICIIFRQIANIHQTFLEIILNFVLFAGLLTVGSIGIHTWKYEYGAGRMRDEALTMSSFCILACVAYFADFITVILLYND
ncbi:hypothetical protein SK128_017382, partial [Halocaridina rubra]